MISSDWVVDIATCATSDISILESPLDPVTHDHSLVFQGTTYKNMGTVCFGAVYPKSPPYSTGHEWGRIKTVMRVEYDTPVWAGIYCLASHLPLTMTGSVYTLGFAGTSHLTLKKNTELGLTSATTKDILIIENVLVIPGTYAIELLWKTSWKRFQGIDFTISMGRDFDTLQKVGHTVEKEDVRSLRPKAEGVFAGTFEQNRQFKVLYGHTIISKITPK